MVKIDILKFNGADLIKKGCQVNVKTFMLYGISSVDTNIVSGVISETHAYEIEVIDENGKRFKTSVQPHTPRISRGLTVKKCSVYGEVIENIENASIVINNLNLNF